MSLESVKRFLVDLSEEWFKQVATLSVFLICGIENQWRLVQLMAVFAVVSLLFSILVNLYAKETAV